MTILQQLAALEAKAKKADEYWKQMCQTAEALGLLVPETVPYLPGWAKKIHERFDAAREGLKRYGKHDVDCQIGYSDASNSSAPALVTSPCTCGLDAAARKAAGL